MIKKQKATANRRRIIFIALGAVILAVGIVALLQHEGVIHLLHKRVIAARTNDEATKGQYTPTGQPTKTPGSGTSSNNASTSPSGSGNMGSDESTDKNPSPASSASPDAPSGNFVSNYQPNLSGSPTPNLIQSVCITTPGATCQISFTKDGVVKSLPVTTTDDGGSAYWTWKLQDYGLTAGPWQITAVATLNGKTAKTVDQLLFNVKP